jgi:lipopolysaccharide transport system permease protein
VAIPGRSPSSQPLRLTEIKPRGSGFDFGLNELWEYRHLLFFFVWRDLKVRYKQTALGSLWALLQPIGTMVVFTLLFGRLAHLPSQGKPYALYVFSALLPWTLFASALGRASISVVANGGLMSKVYFPRLFAPIAAVVSGLVDFMLSLVVLVVLMGFYGTAPPLQVLVLPLLVIAALLVAFAFGLWLAALNAHYRDVGLGIPFVTQTLFFASPVAYSAESVPARWRALYDLNPMTTIINGFRWALLDVPWHAGLSVAFSGIGTLVLLVGGLVFYRRMEKTFVDVV